LRRHDEAQIFYRRALQIDPDDRTVRNNFGLSLALSGRREEAVAVLRKLVSEPDALPRYRENLAYALSRRSAPASRAVPDRRI
jgi:Flp pilus assembly protein TadD